MNCVVTGGAGFIGSNLVDRLVSEGHNVCILDNLSTGRKENLNKNAEFLNLDISNLDSIKSAFIGKDVVFHVAAIPRIGRSIENPQENFRTNAEGTLNVLIASKDAHVKRVVYSASSAVYGAESRLPFSEDMRPMPLNPYALFKYFGEELCKEFTELYGLDTISLRYFNVYGPRVDAEGEYATIIGKFLRMRTNGEPLTIVGDGKQTRDFVFVGDVVGANTSCVDVKKGDGEVINIGSGKSHSVNEIAKAIGGDTVNIPERIGEARHTLADISKAKRLLGWEPKVSLQEGIKKLIGIL